jgi:hypothetical protein
MCFVAMPKKIPVTASTRNSPRAIFGMASSTRIGTSIMSTRRWWRSLRNAAMRASHSSAASWLPVASAARMNRSYRAVIRLSHNRRIMTDAPIGMYARCRPAALVCSCCTMIPMTCTGRSTTDTADGGSSTSSPSTTWPVDPVAPLLLWHARVPNEDRRLVGEHAV